VTEGGGRSVRRPRLYGLAFVALTLGAGPVGPVRVDTWDAAPPGPLVLPGQWRLYPGPRTTFKHPPAIGLDGGRFVLHLRTDHESVGLVRAVRVDLNATPILAWEWKPLALPLGGDVRKPKQNDQAARLMVLFEGMKALVYVWDTTAPVGSVVRPDEFALVDRALVVVRSGPSGLGQWHRETRDVSADYTQIFEEEPRTVKSIGVESHSDDVQSESAVLFGSIRFERR
jgi:hypothetical protein